MANQDQYLRELQRLDACGGPIAQKNYKKALERVVGIKSLEEDQGGLDSLLDNVDSNEAAKHEALIALHENPRLREYFGRFALSQIVSRFGRNISIAYSSNGLSLVTNISPYEYNIKKNRKGKLVYRRNRDLVSNHPQIDPLTVKNGIYNFIKKRAPPKRS